MLIYALLNLTGYVRPTMDDLRNFRQLHSPCAGHPEHIDLSGVETTTGQLGQGLAPSVGMATAARLPNAMSRDYLIDHPTWLIAVDDGLCEHINPETTSPH